MNWPVLNHWLGAQRGFERIFADLNELSRGWPRSPGACRRFPRANAWADDDGIVLRVEIPGVDPDKLELTLEAEKVTVAGGVAVGPKVDEAIYHRGERVGGKFKREFHLPHRVDAKKAKATVRHGVLELSLPRLAADKPRKIDIAAG